MRKFAFDLSTAGLHDIESYILPAPDVPIVYNHETICQTDVNENGWFECELDDDLVERLSMGECHVRPFVEPVTNPVTVQFLKIEEITIFDV